MTRPTYCEICGKPDAAVYPFAIYRSSKIGDISLCRIHANAANLFWRMLSASLRTYVMMTKWAEMERSRMAYERVIKTDELTKEINNAIHNR